jgi:transposase
MQHTTIAIDLAKSVFQVAVSHQPGRVAQRHRLSRSRFVIFMAQQEPAHVLLEACGSAHYWARVLQGQGHTVTLLPAHHVRRYRSGNKTDEADAKALLEASRNERIHAVPIKSVDQQTLAFLHRMRSGWMRTRTARINQARGILRELGFTIPEGATHAVPHVRRYAHDPQAEIPAPLRTVLIQSTEEIRALEAMIHQVEVQLRAMAGQIPAVQHLRTIPGIGLLTSTALVGCVGDIRRFRSGRGFSSFLGITPREHSSGSSRHLGSITKRGDTYLRTLLIHGARSALRSARSKVTPSPLQMWAVELERRRGYNRAVVALANKMARIAWAVWKEQRDFRTVTS